MTEHSYAPNEQETALITFWTASEWKHDASSSDANMLYMDENERPAATDSKHVVQLHFIKVN